MLSRSSSSRSSLSRFVTQPLVSPTRPATSSFESPQLIGKARWVTVHAASGESRSQKLVPFGVEADESWESPLMRLAGELPLGSPLALSLPVDDSESQRGRRPDRETLVSVLGRRIPLQAELPDEGQQIREQVFPIVVAELEAALPDDRATKSLGVIEVVKS